MIKLLWESVSMLRKMEYPYDDLLQSLRDDNLPFVTCHTRYSTHAVDMEINRRLSDSSKI